MVIKGPPPKPTALKRLQGNPGKRPLNRAEPKPTGPIGNAPTHLTSGAKRIWREVVAALPDGVLTVADRHQLELYAALRDWVRETMKEGDAPPTREIVQVRQLAASFGLDPASRTRLSVPEPTQDVDPFAEFLNGTSRN
jgi:phage terminase small subunit